MATEPKSNVTIYQVAAAAGVAISTVSKVLSNKRGISSATREKVLLAVERLGYVPTLAARGLTGGQTGIIGLVFAFPPKMLYRDPFLLDNILGIEEALMDLDYNLLISTGNDQDIAVSFDRLLRGRYFDGVIIVETTEVHRQGLYQKVEQQNLPWVLMGNPQGIPSCYAVFADDVLGGQQLAEHLLYLGHRRFSIVNSEKRPSGVDERLRSFQEVLNRQGIRVEPGETFYGDFSLESGYQIAPAILDRPNRPTAVFSVNDRMALGIIQWAQEHGLRIPQDFSIVGFDDVRAAAESHPSLTTVRQPGVEVGRTVARMLYNTIRGEPTPKQIKLDTLFIARESSGPAPKF
jgi:DNA-binding LacI/PurR family transcriptional regulator